MIASEERLIEIAKKLSTERPSCPKCGGGKYSKAQNFDSSLIRNICLSCGFVAVVTFLEAHEAKQ